MFAFCIAMLFPNPNLPILLIPSVALVMMACSLHVCTSPSLSLALSCTSAPHLQHYTELLQGHFLSAAVVCVPALTCCVLSRPSASQAQAR